MLDKRILGKNIANYRKAKEMTQKELAERLNITAQSISKWEASLSLPTVDMLCELASVLEVSVDVLLSEKILDNRDIGYLDAGLDTNRLYTIKDEVDAMITRDSDILHAHYIDPVVFQTGDGSLVYAMATHVPGSKARLAKERGYDDAICADVSARAFNNILRTGLMPKLLQAHVVCGNKDAGQLREMAHSFKIVCEQNGVSFGGMEIACQPINYGPHDYEVFVSAIGVGERENLLDRQQIKEGDVVIGLASDGIDSTSYPFVRIMLDRRPGLAYEKIDATHYFVDEILRPVTPYTSVARALQEAGLLHGIGRTECSVLNEYLYDMLPDGLGVCMNLSAFPVNPLHRFMQELDMVGKNFFHYRFNMGIGLTVIVPKVKAEQAMDLIKKYHPCYLIGRVEKNETHQGKKLWLEGKIQW